MAYSTMGYAHAKQKRLIALFGPEYLQSGKRKEY
jgi:hypothetical protein